MSVSYYIQVFASLGVLGAILFVFYKFSKSYKNNHFSGDISVIDRKMLDNQTSIVVMKYKKKEFLLSVGSKGVLLLKEYDVSE